MISDEALVKYANRTKGISRNALEVVYLVIQEMATELLAYREAERRNNAKNEDPAPELECTKHVWEFHPELSPHPYVCKVCGENMDENCFGDDL